MEPKDPIVWRIVGVNVVAWIGAGIGAAVSPEFGGDAFSSIVSSQNAMVGAFTGALFGGGVGWLIDRNIGDGRRQRSVATPDHRPTHYDNRPRPRPDEHGNSGGLINSDSRPGNLPSDTGSAGGLRNRENRPDSASAVTAVHNGDNVAVSWTEADRAASYDVFYKTSNMQSWTIAASGHPGTAFVLTGADWSATYIFAVRALNDAGTSDWATSAPASR